MCWFANSNGISLYHFQDECLCMAVMLLEHSVECLFAVCHPESG